MQLKDVIDIFQTVLDFFKEYPFIQSLITFPFGYYFGNKQAIGIDKRKEFNEISKDAYIILNENIEHIEKELDKKGLEPKQYVNDFLFIYDYIPCYKIWIFKKHVEKYKEAQQGLRITSTYNPDTGEYAVTFNQEKMAQLNSSAKALLGYLKRR